jgi:hypothetical protein
MANQLPPGQYLYCKQIGKQIGKNSFAFSVISVEMPVRTDQRILVIGYWLFVVCCLFPVARSPFPIPFYNDRDTCKLNIVHPSAVPWVMFCPDATCRVLTKQQKSQLGRQPKSVSRGKGHSYVND